MNNHIEEFSADRLAKMFTRLGGDIEIRIKHPSPRYKGKGRVKYTTVK